MEATARHTPSCHLRRTLHGRFGMRAAAAPLAIGATPTRRDEHAGLKICPVRESTMATRGILDEIFVDHSIIMLFVLCYLIHPHWAHLSGSQRLCTCLFWTIKGRAHAKIRTSTPFGHSLARSPDNAHTQTSFQLKQYNTQVDCRVLRSGSVAEPLKKKRLNALILVAWQLRSNSHKNITVPRVIYLEF